MSLCRRAPQRRENSTPARASVLNEAQHHPAGRLFEVSFWWNDVELFDLSIDPAHTRNLAADRAANAALILAMSAKRERAVAAGIAVDDGREMPGVPRIT
jgi:hypothetical protein